MDKNPCASRVINVPQIHLTALSTNKHRNLSMDAISLPQLINKINQQITSQEILDTQLRQAHALARVGTIADFDQLSPAVIHDYLWALADRLEHGLQISVCVSTELCSLSKVLIKTGSSVTGVKDH